jgi:hypothetical protein
MKFLILLLLVNVLNARPVMPISYNKQDYSSKTLVYPFYPRDIKGEVYTNLKSGILCEVGYTKTVRNVPSKIRRLVFQRYGITRGHWGEYEVDHFISLTLGGNNSINNLFPQPYEVYLSVNGKDTRMGAREKDVVENNLHKRICRGEITEKQAQEIISTNWVGYYLKLKGKI